MIANAIKVEKNKKKLLKAKNKSNKKNLNESAVVVKDSHANRLTKKEKKAIESKADEQQNDISLEVGKLLAHLKKEHGIVNTEELTVAADDSTESPQKEKGEKKNKKKKSGHAVVEHSNDTETQVAIDSAPIDRKKKHKKSKVDGVKLNGQNEVSPKELKGVKVSGSNLMTKQKKNKKKKNKKRKADESDTINEHDDDSSPAKPKKVKKELKQENKKVTDVDVSARNGTLEAEKSKKKPKNKKKKNKKVAVSPQSNDNNAELVEKNENTADEETANETSEKKEYYLKDATPVYVGNLPTNMKRKRLLKIFKQFGTIVSIRVRTNSGKELKKTTKLSAVPYLIAFVYFEKREAALASAELNGTVIGDHTIKVDADSRDIAAKIKPKNTILVGNLKYAVTEEILRETFECCGSIKYIRVIQTDRGCKGIAYVCFREPESVGLALDLNHSLVLDREIRVEKFQVKKLGAGKLAESKKKKLQGAALRVAKKGGAAARGDGNNRTAKKKNFIKLGASKDGKKAKVFLGAKSNDTKKKFNKKKNKLSDAKRMSMKVAPKAPKPAV